MLPQGPHRGAVRLLTASRRGSKLAEKARRGVKVAVSWAPSRTPRVGAKASANAGRDSAQSAACAALGWLHRRRPVEPPLLVRVVQWERCGRAGHTTDRGADPRARSPISVLAAGQQRPGSTRSTTTASPLVTTSRESTPLSRLITLIDGPSPVTEPEARWVPLTVTE